MDATNMKDAHEGCHVHTIRPVTTFDHSSSTYPSLTQSFLYFQTQNPTHVAKYHVNGTETSQLVNPINSAQSARHFFARRARETHVARPLEVTSCKLIGVLWWFHQIHCGLWLCSPHVCLCRDVNSLFYLQVSKRA